MDNLTAAAYAGILDPERKVPGWWGYGTLGDFMPLASQYTFTGPDDLHTAREHAWRGEDWLIARDCEIYITRNATYVEGPAGEGCPEIANNPNHAAAIAEAVRRIVNEQR